MNSICFLEDQSPSNMRSYQGMILLNKVDCFVGRQDAMQRQSLIPIGDFLKENYSKEGRGFELLDIAAGTGRYATFVKVHLFITSRVSGLLNLSLKCLY